MLATVLEVSHNGLGISDVADLLSKLSFTESKLLETEGKLLVNLNKIEQSLKNTQFIVDPPVNLATKIKRCIAYDVVKNKKTFRE